jgi:hypothetical protein
VEVGWTREELHRVFLWERLKEGDHMRYLDVDGRIILKWIFKKCNGELNGFVWLRMGKFYRLL